MNRIHASRLLLAALAVALVAIAGALAQQPKTQPKKSGEPSDEDQIRKGVVAFVEQYNAHKAEDLAALFGLTREWCTAMAPRSMATTKSSRASRTLLRAVPKQR